MSKKSTLEVRGTLITVFDDAEQKIISLTDMLKAKDGDFFIADWLRNRNTVEFLGIWESVYNPSFIYGEFATIRNQAGLNNYKISVKEWVAATNAIGLKAKITQHPPRRSSPRRVPHPHGHQPIQARQRPDDSSNQGQRNRQKKTANYCGYCAAFEQVFWHFGQVLAREDDYDLEESGNLLANELMEIPAAAKNVA